MMSKWDKFFLEVSRLCGSMSKDPSSKIGSVLVRPNRTIISTGWNGFARGLSDDPELYADREFKIATVVHAEINAILTSREPLDGCTIYVSGLPPCAQCASLIIQAGIRRVVAEKRDIPERWRDNMRMAIRNLLEAGVKVDLVDMTADTIFAVKRSWFPNFVIDDHGVRSERKAHRIYINEGNKEVDL